MNYKYDESKYIINIHYVCAISNTNYDMTNIAQLYNVRTNWIL